jgi:hypothetical protein
MNTIPRKHLLTVFIIILGMGVLSCNLTGNLDEQFGMGSGGGNGADFPEESVGMDEILREFARNQGWPDPEKDTCQDLGSPQPPGTTCLAPLGSEFESNYGLAISHLIQRRSEDDICYIGSTATIYAYEDTSSFGEDVEAAGTESYRNVAVSHYRYTNEIYNALYTRWYYENLTFTISETTYGTGCDQYYPNTQSFQALIDLLEEGYLLTP